MSDFIAQYPVLITSVIKAGVLLFLLLTAVAYITWFERKVVAHIQSRLGPYRVGPHGLLQPLADGLKFLFKEDPEPDGVDKFTYAFAPFLALALALGAIAVIPFGPHDITIFGQRTGLHIIDPSVGILLLFAITSLGVYAVVLAGWASNSKYPLLGGLRSSAQMVSYELALTLSVVGVVLLYGTFNLREMIAAQGGYMLGFIPRWSLFTSPFPQVLGFFCYFVAAIAETNRAPFDLAEAEQELVGGFHTEYSAFKFAMFFMAEYVNMVIVSCLATLLFLGGWHSPFAPNPVTPYLPAAAFGLFGLFLLWDGFTYRTLLGKIVLPGLGVACLGLAALCAAPGPIDFIQGPFWFLAKVGFVLFVYVWVRGTLPRYRYDQLMNIGWKFLLPVAIANLALTAAAILLVQR